MGLHCVVLVEVGLQTNKLLHALQWLVQEPELAGGAAALQRLVPLDGALVLDVLHPRMNATAAPADQRLDLVAPGGIGEAVQRGAVQGGACDGCLTAASLGYGLVVGAVHGIRGRAAQHMPGNGFQLRFVLLQVLFELLLRPKTLCPPAILEGAKDIGPQPTSIGRGQGLVRRNSWMLAQSSLG